METQVITTFSFDELLNFIESSDAPKALQISSLGVYGCIKTSIYLLSQLSDIEEDEANLISFKKASKLLLQVFIKPIINECVRAKKLDSSIQIENVQETLRNESNSRLLCKWWMIYLSILSDTFKTHKSKPNWEDVPDIWFTKEEGDLLKRSYELLEGFYQLKTALLRLCFSMQWFLQEVGSPLTNYLSSNSRDIIQEYFISIINSELEGIEKIKKKNEDKMVIFRKKMLNELFLAVNSTATNDYLWSSMISGHFSKNNPKYPLSHSIACGDDGGLYALMNTVSDIEREMLFETGDIQNEYLELCEINQKKSQNSHKIVIGQGSFGKIRIAIALTKSETSDTMNAGQIVCVKKTAYFNKPILNKKNKIIGYVSWKEILENSWSDYSVGDVAHLVFSPPVYDMTIIEPVHPIEQKHQKGYTFQKLVPVYDGFKAFSIDKNTQKKGKYHGQWEHQRSYLIEIFVVVSKLLNIGICMTDLKPQNTLYDGENFKAVVIDLAGVVRKINRSKLTKISVEDIMEFSPNWSAPEIVNENNDVDLTLCMSYSLGLFIEKLVLFEAPTHPYKAPLSELAQQMMQLESKSRISVEEGLVILRGIGHNNLSNKIDFKSFIVKLQNETKDDPMRFGLNPNIKNVQKSLINLMAAAVDPLKYEVKHEDFTFLKNDFDDFVYSRKIADKERVFVLLGSSGSGKSTILQLSYLEYLSNWKEGDPIPIFINLSVEEEIRIQWKWLCKSLSFEENLTFNLFSGYHYPLILFIDSFDEVANKINFVTKFLDDSGNNSLNKCIICCRSEFIQRDSDYVKFFQPQNSEKKEIKKRFISPLTEKNFSLEEYFNNYYKVWESDSQLIDPQKVIKVIKQKNLTAMMKTSYMVHLTLEVMPNIIKSNIDALVTRSKIFEYYIKRKIDKIENEVQDLIMDKMNQEFKDLQFGQIIQKAAYLLAEILHCESSTKTDNGKILGKIFFNQHLFDSNTPCFKNHVLSGVFRALDLTVEIRGAIPSENISIGFSHDSIKNYFLTQAICKESLLNKPEGILSRKLLVEDKALITFLAELVKETEEFQKKLKELVLKSREEGESKVIVASNAITILIAANVSLARIDLSGIRIKGANLRDGVFSGSDFSDADLTAVILENWIKQFSKEP